MKLLFATVFLLTLAGCVANHFDSELAVTILAFPAGASVGLAQTLMRKESK